MSDAPRPHVSSLFVVLWSAFVVLHQWKQLPLAPHEAWHVTFVRGAMCLAALLSLARPQSLRALMGVSALQLLGVLTQLPAMSNSWIAGGCFSVGILGACALSFQRGERTVAAAWQVVAPPARATLIVFYFYAALAKFNWDFVDVEVSCGTALWDNMGVLPGQPVFAWIAIVVTLVVEAGIPILLAIPRLRAWGVASGLGFHAFIAMTPWVHIFDFSLLMFTMYVFFLPENFLSRVRSDPNLRVPKTLAERRVLVGALVVAIASVAALATWYDGNVDRLIVIRSLVWNTLSVILVVFGWYTLSRPGHDFSGQSLVPSHALTSAGVLLMTLNGAAPYLGLKTTSSYTMFSNLKTEEGVWNHMLVPSAARVFGFQDGLVEIVDTDIESLANAGEKGHRIVWFDLTNVAARYPEGRLVFRRQGETFTADPISAAAFFDEAPGPIARRFLSFRTVDIESRSCQW